MHSDCPSPSICLIQNPLPWYVSIICCIDLIIVVFVSFLSISSVPKCIALEAMITNSPSGRLLQASIITLDGVLQVILPFNDPRLGPRISSALTLSSFLTGQFWIRPFSM